MVTVVYSNGDSNPLVYSDTLGNSASENPFFSCQPSGTPCTDPHAGMAQSYSLAFASRSSVLFFYSSGSFSGSVTFTGTSSSAGMNIYVGEYGQDLVNVDVGTQTTPGTLVTTGANDLIISTAGDTGVATCTFDTPASGFTIEYSPTNCLNYSDRINVPPGSYATWTTASSGSIVPGWSTIAFGVAPFVSAKVRHARNIY